MFAFLCCHSFSCTNTEKGKYSIRLLKGFLPEKEGHDLRVAIENRNHERCFLGMIWDFDLSASVDELVELAKVYA